MNKIYGDAQVIQRAQNARPGDPVALVNWDAIKQIPDQYEAIISEVKFDLNKDFADVGNKVYMPTPALMYKIAEAKGIQGGSDSISEAIYETVDLSEMTMADTPDLQKIVVGYRCRKYATVLEEDGRERRSAVCTIDYNVWNRVTEMWSKEEVYTEGYTKAAKYPPKYKTKWARKNHFKSELKFAMQKAETKAHEKAIRELAGLMTGYKAEDLTEGRLIFAKIRRSQEDMKLEAAARYTALSKGLEPSQETQALLFGNVDKDMPISGSAPTSDVPPQSEQEPVASQPFNDYAAENTPAYQRLIDAIDSYNQQGLIPPGDATTAQGIIGWVESKGADAEADGQYWPKAIGILKKIEDGIKMELRIKHGLY